MLSKRRLKNFTVWQFNSKNSSQAVQGEKNAFDFDQDPQESEEARLLKAGSTTCSGKVAIKGGRQEQLRLFVALS